MFSIRDARSRPIAFGGRVLPQLADERSAKYINSPETPLFSKSRELYGLDVARETFQARRRRDRHGRLHRCAHGPSTRHRQLSSPCSARRSASAICNFCAATPIASRSCSMATRPADVARTKFSTHCWHCLKKIRSILRILTLPEGIDPCDFIATHGSDPFRQLLAQAVDALEHKFKAVTNGLDTLTDTHRASQAAEQLLATLAQIRPAGGGASSQTLLREEQMLSRIARQFHLPEEKLRSRLTSHASRSARQRTPRSQRAARRSTQRASRQRNRSALADLPAWDRELLELMLLDPTLHRPRRRRRSSRTRFTSPVARRIYVACCRLADGRLAARFRPPAGRVRRPGHEESAGRSSTNRARQSHGRPRALARRLAGNASPPRRRRRPPHRPRRRPPKRRATPNNCSRNSANNPNRNTSASTKGERSRVGYVVRSR